MADTLIVYGAMCAWWDDISKAANTDPVDKRGLPVCPHCRRPLFQMEPEEWWRKVELFAALGNPGYREQVEALRGKSCRELSGP